MKSYTLSWEMDGWTLRSLPENQKIRTFTDKAHALHESLHFVCRTAATLVLNPQSTTGRGSHRTR
ncbi:MAG: hypothetical protein EOP86_00055 [Verrucomicrobiaceae bacterium]|nr:MAG: hypothetical protein EOP86_00055 [Verrucomicrobiaceae bacterium]